MNHSLSNMYHPNPMEQKAKEHEKNENEIGKANIMVFGDSNASALVVPRQWMKRFGTVHVEKFPGIRARDAVDLFSVALTQDKPLIVILVIGTNDMADDDRWRKHLGVLYDLGLSHCDQTCLVPPDSGFPRKDGVHYSDEAYKQIRDALYVEGKDMIDALYISQHYNKDSVCTEDGVYNKST